MIATNSEETALNVQSVMERLQRSEISNPPAFGAKIASTILNNAELRKMWYQDLITMSSRIQNMRHALFERLVENGMLSPCNLFVMGLSGLLMVFLGAPGNWDHIIRQTGMFAILGLSPDVVSRLKGNVEARH